MTYVILCYRDEGVIDASGRETETQVGRRLDALLEQMLVGDVLGFGARLLPTTTATTLRRLRGGPFVTDGPSSVSGEQLLGVYLVDCETLDAALYVAARFAEMEPGGIYEVRPTARTFTPALVHEAPHA